MKCYRCQKALSPNDTTCASCGQAVYTTHTGPGLAMGRRVDGALASDPSPRDYIATANLPSLPRQVNLRQHCSAVEEQGQLASCVACSVVGAMEHAERKAGRPAAEFSRMFLYFNGRRLRGTPDRDSGMSVPQCLAAFLAFGAPPESAWPYKPDLLAKEPDAAAYAQALA